MLSPVLPPSHDAPVHPNNDTHQIGELGVSIDFRTVTFRDMVYRLTEKQAQAVRILWDAFKAGKPTLSERHILQKLTNSRSDRLRDVFRSRPEFFRRFIKSSDGGFYALIVPD